ncbi:hypothetical protein JCM16303_003165 [Sporobolomyces ruberrimus]
MFSGIYNTLSGALGASSAPSSTPSTPPPADPTSSSKLADPSTSTPRDDAATPHSDAEPTLAQTVASSAFYRKLVDRNKHSSERLLKIRQEAVKDKPPKEPTPEECCGEACGLECVTTMCWRDLHSDWRSIKAQVAAEEEELRRAREEEEALNGGPELEISIDEQGEKSETEEDVMDQITRGWKG